MDDKATDATTDVVPESTRGPRRRRRWIGPVLIALVLGAAGVARYQAPSWGFQMANIILYVAVVVTFITSIVWYLEFGPGSFRRRLLVSIAVAVCPLIFFSVFRVEGVTGELGLRLRPVWRPPADAALHPARAEVDQQTQLDLSPSPNDFPEFLGPGRRNRLPHVTIDTDWNAHPPKLRWRRRIGAGWSGFSVRGPLAATMEQRGNEELVTCYEVESGRLVWSHAIEGRHETTLGGVGPRATPTWDGERLYALGPRGDLRAFDGRNGELLWHVNLLAEYGVTPEDDLSAVAWGRAGSPLVVDHLVVVPYGGPRDGRKYSLAAYDKETGKRVWRGGDRQVSYASPIVATIAGVRQIVSVNEDNVSGHDVATGKELWSHPWPGSSTAGASVSQPVPLPGDHLLLSKAYGGGAKLIRLKHLPDGRWETEPVWSKSSLLKTKFTNVTVFDAYVYGLSDSILECVEWRTGRRRWKVRKARYGQGQILGLGDVILVQAERGYVAVVRATPERYEELARFPALDGQTWNNLCFAPPYLLVRNSMEAACYELRVRPTPDETAF